MGRENKKMTIINSKSGNTKELKEIDIFIDAILNSNDTYIENHDSGRKIIYKYENDKLIITKEVKQSSTYRKIVQQGTEKELYDGKRVRDIREWLPDLIAIAKSVEQENNMPNKHR